MRTPALCPKCGAVVHGVEFRLSVSDEVGEGPDPAMAFFRPCGHPVSEEDLIE
jgi:hypothetical protein